MALCERCLYKGNCQYLARHKKTVVEDCTAFNNASDFVKLHYGEWIARDRNSISKRGRVIRYATYKCSICRKWNGRHTPNYCPNCGSKMVGERKGE